MQRFSLVATLELLAGIETSAAYRVLPVSFASGRADESQLSIDIEREAAMTQPICACGSCGSNNLTEFDTQLNLRRLPLNGLNKPILCAFPKIVLCLYCGFAQFQFSDAELQRLREVTACALTKSGV